MPARFRIRTARGQELSFASREIFAEFVRSGDLAPADVVYDAETREWSSALTHPVVLQIKLDAEETAGAEETGARRAGSADEADEAGDAEGETLVEGPTGTTGRAVDIGLDLAPAQGLTPEEEAAAFVAKMEAERASDLDVEEDPSIGSFVVEPASSVFGPGAHEPLPKTPQSSTAPARPAKSGSSRKATARSAPPKEKKKKKAKPPKRKKARSGAGRKLAPFMILAVGAVVAAVYLGPELLGPGGDAEGSTATDTARADPPPSIPDNEEALRRRAQERFLSSTQAQLRKLEPIPDIWLHGQYLAAPSDYPRVREVWESYLTTIQQVRSGDDERYRGAYLQALSDARIEGSSRTLRLTAATADFRADSAARSAFYDRVEALATAAIQGHDALVEAEGTISYEPVTGPRVSADPVLEAAGRNAEAQTLLDQVLDRILSQMHAGGGPGESRNVREWVWDGFLDAVTG